MKILIIITAGGKGTRFGSSVPKQLLPFGTSTVLEHTVKKFLQYPHHTLDLCLTIPDLSDSNYTKFNELCDYVIQGGAERQYSIAGAVLSDFSSQYDIILVHDGVRPLFSHELITLLLDSVQRYDAVIPVLPMNETIKTVNENKIIHTIDRTSLVTVQTPQVFRADILINSYRKATELNTLYTDDAALVEAAGYTVYTVRGEQSNIKITTQFDMSLANFLLEKGLAS